MSETENWTDDAAGTVALSTGIIDVSAYDGLAACISAIGGSANRTLLLHEDFQVTGHVTVPSNVNLLFTKGGKLSIATGVPVTINGTVTAPPVQIFALSGTGLVAFGKGSADEIRPEWYGAVTGAANNSTAFFNNAIDAASAMGGCVVKFGDGDWYCHPVMKRYVTFRGNGFNSCIRPYSNASTITFNTAQAYLSEVVMENFRIIGDITKTSQNGIEIVPTAAAEGAPATQFNRIVLRDVWISYCGKRGLFISGIGNNTGEAFVQNFCQDGLLYIGYCNEEAIYAAGGYWEMSFEHIRTYKNGAISNRAFYFGRNLSYAEGISRSAHRTLIKTCTFNSGDLTDSGIILHLENVMQFTVQNGNFELAGAGAEKKYLRITGSYNRGILFQNCNFQNSLALANPFVIETGKSVKFDNCFFWGSENVTRGFSSNDLRTNGGLREYMFDNCYFASNYLQPYEGSGSNRLDEADGDGPVPDHTEPFYVGANGVAITVLRGGINNRLYCMMSSETDIATTNFILNAGYFKLTKNWRPKAVREFILLRCFSASPSPTGAEIYWHEVTRSHPVHYAAASPATSFAGTYWYVGEECLNTVPAADGNNMILRGWVCTTAGVAGAAAVFTSMYVSAVSPAT